MSVSGDDAQMAEVFSELAEAIRDMRVDRIPPPTAFAGMGGSSGINSFFRIFEKYCNAVYKKDPKSWLQVLPSFLEGEARSIVRAFGVDADYHIVKQRLIDEFTNRSTLSSNEFSDFFSATRHLGESLTCFSIRLETLAGKVAQASTNNQDLMIKSKFLSSLPVAMIQQLNIQLGHQETAPLNQIVRLATVLENQNASWGGLKPVEVLPVSVVSDEKKPDFRSSVQCDFCGKRGHAESDCFAKEVVCHSCGSRGHYRRNCPKKGGSTKNDRRVDGVVNIVPNCEFCGNGKHVLANCDLFKRRCMSCVWCGSLEHESYKCLMKPSGSGNARRPEF